MEIYILDNRTLDRIGIVDVYQSFIWNTSFSDTGSFELRCSISFFDLLQTDRIIQNTEDDKHNGIIEFITKITEDDGSESLSVKGRMLEVILDRRIAVGAYSYESIQPSSIASDLITKNAILDRPIPLLEIGSLVDSDFGVMDYAGSNASLFEEIKDILATNQIGFNVKADDENKKLIFETYKGVNRTEEDNIETDIEVRATSNLLSNGELQGGLANWTEVSGGSNYNGEKVLSYVTGGTIGGMCKKTKIKDRYEEYDDEGEFERWVYFFMPAGYIYQSVNLSKEHLYYIRVSFNNPTDSILGYGIVSEGACLIQAERTSGIKDVGVLFSPKESGQYTFALAQGELDDIEGLSAYSDYGLVVNLTETFGVGKEPSLTFCNKNIYYEGGWKYKIEITSFIENETDPLVLSRDRDTLLEVEYTKAITNHCTYLHVKGADNIESHITTGEETGLDRKERFLDLSSSVPRVVDGVTIPLNSYMAMLESSAKAVLRKLVINEMIDGILYPLSNKKFGRDFYLGDMINCVDNIGIESILRITEVSESWDTSGYSLSITLGDSVPNIYETIKLVGKGAK